MRLTVVGSGDAFGSGGRLQTCFHVVPDGAPADGAFLVDCGATALIGMQRLGLDPNGVGTVLLSHLHGDHFSGLVWWLLHAQHVARRTAPLLIAGPPGVEARVQAACEVLFPGSSMARRRFETRFAEYTIGAPLQAGPARVTAHEVVHPSGAPSCALRMEVGTKTLAYSGDTQWTDALLPASADADLFICECYGFDVAAPYHIAWHTLEAQLPRITARRLLLTHMSAPMLARLAEVHAPRVAFAEDGLVVDV